MEKKQTKYGGVVRHVENLIEKGALKPGDRVPSENRLSDEFGISRQTVRRAIGILEEKGVLRRVR
ncbi:MAG: winged helix-turn-helix domain-containing protein, partial [Acetatifactor sp.]|nr:winged helix-turn-helix domain-containing protein [Acetatifactor sp.]